MNFLRIFIPLTIGIWILVSWSNDNSLIALGIVALGAVNLSFGILAIVDDLEKALHYDKKVIESD